ncbi:hypothetical protein CTEN210_05517 [Chaetoceros tenuissimus]|uniref:Spindle and kinetochore-associated protein 1 n=1 Tax=Chaetoceros tenuissimus TaxID=426638 RepID=A0AAD3CQ31_9STRA|nr:hypothetical protein CTEN210_05517 [Chaetoceros tenuissimus]
MEVTKEAEDAIHELSNTFSQTLQSLSKEAALMQQISSLKIATMGSTFSSTNSKTLVNDENFDPNLDKEEKSPQNEINQSMVQQLNGIHAILSQLESKVATIGQVLQEEKAAVQSLESTKASAMAQKKYLQNISQQLEDQDLYDLLPGNGLVQMGKSIGTLFGNERHQSSKKEGHDSKVNPSYTQQTSTPSSTFNAKTPLHPSSSESSPSQNFLQIKVRPIDQIEYAAIPKTVRGRFGLIALNEALTDIQKVIESRYHHLRQHSSIWASQTKRSNHAILQSTPIHSTPAKNSHTYHPIVSEQEMRDNCSFFRSGESSARAILQILRSCKRIKQLFLSQEDADKLDEMIIGGTSLRSVGRNTSKATLITYYAWIDK